MKIPGNPRAAERTDMGDLTSQRLIVLKGWMFLLAGLMSGGLLLFENPALRNAALLAICVWSFCRFYYFAFYVIEHYVDGRFKYAGLFDFLKRTLWRRKSVDH